GEEITFCSIGDASTSEGIFWETLNAATVARVPLCIVVWDDGYGISVPVELQTTKGSISKALEGFLIDEEDNGILIYTAKAWDYSEMINVFDKATQKIRKQHRPALIHIQGCTQPQGHSTSGSHERYKSKERLEWEIEYDGILKMEEWIVSNSIADQETLDSIKKEAKTFVKQESKKAWKAYQENIIEKRATLKNIYNSLSSITELAELSSDLDKMLEPTFGEVLSNARILGHKVRTLGYEVPEALSLFIDEGKQYGLDNYHTYLYSNTDKSAINIPIVDKAFSENSKVVNGYQVINTFFDKAFEKYPNTFAFGEDVGNIGDVNQGFAGLQDKYGSDRIFDTGIREWSIMGQAIGMAMRGLRPIAEIQYLDYLIYGLAPLTDDLATLRYRSNNLQMAPAIIRSRGHRLEGIWHAGSPFGLICGSLRGMHVCVPRNFVQAAGMYNTLLKSSDPAIVVEVLNGYRIKEKMPDNIGEYTVPLGVPEVIVEGDDLTIVTYGPNVRYAQQAIENLPGLSIELIDVQTLIPFDLEHIIVESLKKTNRILFLDEDVPGGSTGYMMQKVLEEQGGYFYLDAKPHTLSASENRTAFGSDGDYFCKPQVEDIMDAILKVLEE
ncbi:MAG: transketolase, partial [Bacteroidia bacterium]|nr:transketolase [Bacteroidia bacterium]